MPKKATWYTANMKKETIKRFAKTSGTTLTSLAGYLGIQQPDFSRRLERDTIKDSDRKKIAHAVGARYFCGFILPDGTIIQDEQADPVRVVVIDDPEKDARNQWKKRLGRTLSKLASDLEKKTAGKADESAILEGVQD